MTEGGRIRAETIVPTKTAQALRVGIVERFGGVSSTGNGAVTLLEFATYGNRIELSPDASGLSIWIEARDPAALFFLKEEMVARVAALDPIAARAIRWGGGDEAGAVPPTFSALRLIRTSDLAVGLRRLTLKGYDLGRFACGGLHLRAIVPLHPGRAPVWPVLEANGATRWPRGADRLHMRVLTLRHMRINSGELDLDVAIHGQGRLSTWAQSAQEGAVLGVMGSGGEAGLPASNGLLLAGDRSALPAIARLLETLPAEATGDLVLDVALETAARAYLPPTRLRLHLLPEGRFPEQVEARLRELGRQRDVRHLWFGGRLDNARKLRRLATNDFKLDPDQHSCTAYWREAPHRSKGT